MIEAERRKVERFALEVPAFLSMMDESGRPRKYEVKTRDICSGGAFFSTDQWMPVGADVKIDLVISFDKDSILKDAKTHIDIEGWVVRKETGGIAVCFDKRYNIKPFAGHC